jgi:hypothetical protein
MAAVNSANSDSNLTLYCHVSQIQDSDLSNNFIVGQGSKGQDSRNLNDAKAFVVHAVKVYAGAVV